jgi:transcriptional regulator
MYLPAPFESSDPEHAAALIREYPLAQLVSVDEQGFPFVTPLPLHRRAGEPVVLLGHVAKPNPHWRYLAQRPEVLACFMGPQAYMSPAVYPDLARVPTWSYLTVQCRGRARLVQAPNDVEAILKALVADHEQAYLQQWNELDEAFRQRMLSGIVAFEIEVHSVQCKLKLNQHRPESHAAMQAAYAQGHAQEQALAAWMQRLGLGAPHTPRA